MNVAGIDLELTDRLIEFPDKLDILILDLECKSGGEVLRETKGVDPLRPVIESMITLSDPGPILRVNKLRETPP
jgi:hypothetical protein